MFTSQIISFKRLCINTFEYSNSKATMWQCLVVVLLRGAKLYTCNEKRYNTQQWSFFNCAFQSCRNQYIFWNMFAFAVSTIRVLKIIIKL
jgi:hypothetical protein